MKHLPKAALMTLLIFVVCTVGIASDDMVRQDIKIFNLPLAHSLIGPVPTLDMTNGDIDRKSTAWTDGHSQGKGQRTKAVPCDCAEGREIAAGWERTKQKKLDKLNKKQGRRADGFTPAGGAF